MEDGGTEEKRGSKGVEMEMECQKQEDEEKDGQMPEKEVQPTKKYYPQIKNLQTKCKKNKDKGKEAQVW